MERDQETIDQSKITDQTFVTERTLGDITRVRAILDYIAENNRAPFDPVISKRAEGAGDAIRWFLGDDTALNAFGISPKFWVKISDLED